MRNILCFLLALLIMGCDKDDSTSVSCIIFNQSSSNIILEYSPTEEDSTYSTELFPNDPFGVFSKYWHYLRSEPDEAEFRELGSFLRIFANDSLIIDETPLNKNNWNLHYKADDYFMWTVHRTIDYAITINDSLIAAQLANNL